MIIEYQRPHSMQEALTLLAREEPVSYPLGGGTVLNQGSDMEYAVVDLQELGLDAIEHKGNQIKVGATAKLQILYDFEGLPEDYYKALELETTYNLRQMVTLAGMLVTANGRSPLTTVLMALNTNLEIRSLDSKPEQVKLGDWLPVRDKSRPGKLITTISIATNLKLAYEYIARSPADQPIVCVAVAQWASGRTRAALGGWGEAPILAMDGTSADGIDAACRSAYSQAEDVWGSAEYRHEMAGLLATRCIQRINKM